MCWPRGCRRVPERVSSCWRQVERGCRSAPPYRARQPVPAGRNNYAEALCDGEAPEQGYDGSIIPSVPSAGTDATVHAIAERAADPIRGTYPTSSADRSTAHAE